MTGDVGRRSQPHNGSLTPLSLLHCSFTMWEAKGFPSQRSQNFPRQTFGCLFYNALFVVHRCAICGTLFRVFDQGEDQELILEKVLLSLLLPPFLLEAKCQAVSWLL